MLQQTTILNVLTAILAVATVWLAVATQRMARATRDTLKLQSQGYLAFSDLEFKFLHIQTSPEEPAQLTAVRCGLILRNPGSVPVDYQVHRLAITFNSSTLENPQYKNLGIRTFPGETTKFWYGNIPITGPLVAPLKGIVDFDIEFWSEALGPKKRLTQEIEYTIFQFEPFVHEWVVVSSNPI